MTAQSTSRLIPPLRGRCTQNRWRKPADRMRPIARIAQPAAAKRQRWTGSQPTPKRTEGRGIVARTAPKVGESWPAPQSTEGARIVATGASPWSRSRALSPPRQGRRSA